ncbi:MAG TPA: HRDC domain-containing protein, partial [Chloroflexota bacterium]
KSEAIQRHGHAALSVYGLLSGDGEQAVRSWIDQLVVQGYLELMEREQFTLLAMTPAGRDLCRLKENPPDGVRLGRYARQRGLFAKAESRDLSGELFERLRALRRLIADAQGVPPYIVFTDLTLSEMARLMPASPIDMLAVRGVGAAKLQRYGDAFLAALQGDAVDAAATRIAY